MRSLVRDGKWLGVQDATFGDIVVRVDNKMSSTNKAETKEAVDTDVIADRDLETGRLPRCGHVREMELNNSGKIGDDASCLIAVADDSG